MPVPALDLSTHLDTLDLTGWPAGKLSVGRLYHLLAQRGWKVDTEESNLMGAMSKTWREEGIKVWLQLGELTCAPPADEAEKIEKISFYRFDPSAMPTETMHEKMYEPGDEAQDWYPSHRETWEWLIDNGDPQFDSFDLLQPISFREVPSAILREAFADIEAAVEIVE